MKTLKIEVVETIRYQDEIRVTLPDNMTEESFQEVLKAVKQGLKLINGGAKEMATLLTAAGIKVDSQSYSYPDSPLNSELEIVNVSEDTYRLRDHIEIIVVDR